MPENVWVLDCRVDELQANLNLRTGEYAFACWNFYDRAEERRVTVVMWRCRPALIRAECAETEDS